MIHHLCHSLVTKISSVASRISQMGEGTNPRGGATHYLAKSKIGSANGLTMTLLESKVCVLVSTYLEFWTLSSVKRSSFVLAIG